MNGASTDIRITPSLVSEIISKLDTHKTSRYDGIPAVVLKNCAPERTPGLSNLYKTLPAPFQTVPLFLRNLEKILILKLSLY